MSGHHVAVAGAGKRFGAVTALAEVDFTVEPGQFLVLLGPSGSGKSTLVRALAGVERLDSGTIGLSGRLVDGAGRLVPPERRDLAMVFQDYALWPHLTVRRNVGYALRRRRLPAREHRLRVEAAVERVGLAAHLDRYPDELSGGEQQRVALARAVVAEPGLLLFDEPLSNLDADLRERLRQEIATLTRECGATAVYITHDQSEAFALADRIGVLDRGRLVQLAAPEQLYRTPATAFVARFTGVAGELAGTVVEGGPQVVSVSVAGGIVRARPFGALPRGAAVRLLPRPDALALAPVAAGAGTEPGTEPASGTGSGAGVGRLRGTVRDVAYRGRGYDHVVDCGGGILSAVRSPVARGRGETVTVSLELDGCLAYPVDPVGSDATDLTAVMLSSSAAGVGAAE